MHIYARQGDLIIDRITEVLTEDTVKRHDVVFAGDSSGHRHRLLGDVLVSTTDPRRFRLESPTEIIHEKSDGHTSIPMPAGDYRIRPLRERGDAGDREVED